MGYPTDLLSSRAIIKHGLYALITPEGLVNNSVPGFVNCYVSILGSPRLGAHFVDYIVTMYEGGRNLRGFGGEEGVETFLYVVGGTVKVTTEQEWILREGGYIYCPPGTKMLLENLDRGESKIFLYKRMYSPLEGESMPHVVAGNAHEIEEMPYDGMKEMRIQDLLPADDFAFDINFHILTFDPGICHPFIETHYQEHGAYLLSGEALYNLDNVWIPVKQGDYIYMGPYVQQACYAVGRERLSYVYSKDCHRDAEL
ncbi:MAG: (S)-ureidoglycine aminohydrolase [Sulfobacillus acidophilus]|uniref:(S)-ureidoglycine aminohydrolase n=1 Tax=Sulfobacillus acidophilus TaxID=53633 RepID=A0A2T2WH34_9FIRM|nr:MAG: (S)-ureidoglycine aminohydrolase [Sulfobacillus acidophilus]